MMIMIVCVNRLTIITDLIIFILPIPIVGPLNLPRRQKIVVVGIFALGFLYAFFVFLTLHSRSYPPFLYLTPKKKKHMHSLPRPPGNPGKIKHQPRS